MLSKKFDQKTINKALAMHKKGKSTTDIGTAIGVNRRTVHDWIKAYQAGDTVTVHEVPEITSAFPSAPTIAEVWEKAEQINRQKIAEAKGLHDFEATFTDNLPIAITFASDQHISVGNTVDLELMRADAELIAATDGMSVVCVGDACDNHTKHRAAMIHARSTPGDQYKLFDYYLSIIKDKLLVLISGNHDDWTTQFAGIDVLKMLADKNKVMYAPDEARINVHLPGHTYEIAARHQYRFNSQINQTHSMKQWWRFGSKPFDIGCLAHLHELALEPVVMHGLERWVCRPGSYQITSAYSRQLGYNLVQPSCPTFVLSSDRREIVGFTSIRPAARYLGYERERARLENANRKVPRRLKGK